MLKWLLKLFRHECKFVIVEDICARNKYGNYTRYARLICEHPLCDNVLYFPSDNRKIHEEWIEKGDM